MAVRERLTQARDNAGLPVFHLTLGLAMALFVIIQRPREGDPLPFYRMAERFAGGAVAYRDYQIEYPPLALPPIYLPRLLGGPSEFAYELIFSLMSIALALATAAAVYWLARRGWSHDTSLNSLLVFVSLTLAAWPVVVWRFDILPALLTVLALVAYAAQQSAWTGVALGLGTAAKLYPAFLGPVFFLARLVERRFLSAGLILGGAFVTVAALAIQVYSVAGLDAFSYVLYQEERGVEIESIAGGLALLGDVVGMVGARVFLGFGSWQVASQLLGQMAPALRVFDILMLGSLGLAAIWSFRRDVRATGVVQPLTLVTYIVATLLVVILTNKVLSPQYLVWLLPFAALLPARQSLALMPILVLTTLIYPLSFRSLVSVDASAVIALNIRNAMLLVLYVWIVWPRELVPALRSRFRPAPA